MKFIVHVLHHQRSATDIKRIVFDFKVNSRVLDYSWTDSKVRLLIALGVRYLHTSFHNFYHILSWGNRQSQICSKDFLIELT